MFVDQVTIHVKAGDGGNGVVAFRREKYVDKGGPAGGDGGAGGDIIFEVDEGLNTLIKFRYNRHYKAKNGMNGQGKGQHGKSADPLIVKVPPGTIVRDMHTKETLGDLTKDGQRLLVAKGGRGGRGNTRFASSRNPAPTIAENGEPGEEKQLEIELKLIADVGLVGFPSVGKSTILSVVSRAKPKIADYHFTTLAPNLGVVSTSDHRSFVMADLPGLIEGAHEGIGLGHQFLKHIERTRMIAHVIDMAAVEGRNPYDDYVKINYELAQFYKPLTDKPQIIIANKMELPDARKNLKDFKSQLEKDVPIFPISAATRVGVEALIYGLADLLDELPEQDDDAIEDDVPIIRPDTEEQPFIITRDSNGIFILSGEQLEKRFKMTDFSSEESAQRFARTLRYMGVDDALRERGVKDGDIIKILDYEFEFID